MALLIKTDALELTFGARHEFVHWPLWKPDPAPGDETFVVFGEIGAPNKGLVARGLACDVTLSEGKIRIGFHPAQITPSIPLTFQHLKAIPRGDTSTPLGSLAQKLYWHAHNKICELTPEETQHLRARFNPTAP